MNPEYHLTFELLSYWHIGNGSEAGAYADALVLKDSHGLPYIPGKSIKGLLRQAFMTANDNQWFGTPSCELMQLLFGDEKRSGEQAQGLIQLSSAHISAPEVAFFTQQPEAKSHLYQVLHSTAINEETGVAQETSLRSMEVAVPMTLTAILTLNTLHPEYARPENQVCGQFGAWLSQAVTLVTELGAKRHRGLGKVLVTSQAMNRE